MSKAGRPKKGSTKLPEWFDIEKYRCVKEMGAAGWFRQMVIRSAMFGYEAELERIRANGGGSNKQERWHESLSLPWHQLRDLIWKDPIITRKRIEDLVPFGDDEDPKSPWYHFSFVQSYFIGMIHIGEQGLHEATCLDVFFGYSKFPDKYKTFLNTPGNITQIFDGGIDIHIKYETPEEEVAALQKFLHSPCSLMAPLISVDLELPNEVLLAEFEEFLREKRKANGQTSSFPFFRGADFKDWYNSGVLPYLDLLLWEKITGTPIYWPIFASVLDDILDDHIIGDGALRKTTRAHAAKLMDDSTIKTLHSQASREKAGKLEKSGKLFVK